MSRLLPGAVLVLALTACSHEQAAPPPAPSPAPTARPAYDDSLTPALAVLALVPDTARIVTVTDLTVAHVQVGVPGLSSHSAPDDVARWHRHGPRQAVLGDPVLAPVDARLRGGFGFGADDVAWQAVWDGGVALRFEDGVDMRAVARAVRAGVGPLAGLDVRRDDHLVATPVPDGPVWASDPWWTGLVADRGTVTYLVRGCEAHAEPGHAELDDLDGYSVTFGDHVATVRLGHERTDLFDRLDLARRAHGDFGRAFAQGVGDPTTGRIGFVVRRPALASRVVTEGSLPFGACP